MKNKFDLIVFDWDGTLMDSVDWIVQCMISAAEEMGCAKPKEQQVKNIVGLSIHNAIEQLFPALNSLERVQFIENYSKVFFSRKITQADLFCGVVEMLNQLKQQGYKMAVATGKGRNGLDKAMEGTGLKGFFDVTACADETASKPGPEMLNYIIKILDVKHERVLMIGDSIHDMGMAKNAGVSSIAVLCGANSMQQMELYNPLLNLKNTTELINIL